MLKILSSAQMKEADAYTIAHEPISAFDLMERAANACVKWIVTKYSIKNNFVIVCGNGNNGGDGLAISRLLLERGFNVRTYLFNSSTNFSELYLQNKSNLLQTKGQQVIELGEDFTKMEVNSQSVIVDAIFGSGLNRELSVAAQMLIEFINQFPNDVIAIDLPSGLHSEPIKEAGTVICVNATYTLTFHAPKLTFLFQEYGEPVGEFVVLDIGIDKGFVNQVKSNYFLITADDIELIGKKRPSFGNKGTFGHALIRAGSPSKLGAAILAIHAALRSGVGLVTAALPEVGRQALNSSLPEAMYFGEEFQLNSNFSKFSAIGIGPGIGTDKDVAAEVKLLIQNYPRPIVFDADAITILAENKTWLVFVTPNSIFTPHFKEFDRLCGRADNANHRLELAMEFCKKYNVYLVLKGKYSCIVCPDGTYYFNSTGNSGMAKGGSGDVLTGLLTGILAQGYSSKAACIMAVYLHGMAGDYAAGHFSESAMKAGDIITCFNQAFKRFSWENTK